MGKIFALITTSDRFGYDDAIAQCESIDSYNKTRYCSHYIIVPKRDYYLFQELDFNSDRVHRQVLVLEDVVKVKRLPFGFAWLASTRQGQMVTSQKILLELVRLAIAKWLHKDVDYIVHLDKDFCFFKDFDLSSYIIYGKPRLYSKPMFGSELKGAIKQDDDFRTQSACSRILCTSSLLDIKDFANNDYCDRLVIWDKSVTLSLIKALERSHGGLPEAIFSFCNGACHRTLYGMFADTYYRYKHAQVIEPLCVPLSTEEETNEEFMGKLKQADYIGFYKQDAA